MVQRLKLVGAAQGFNWLPVFVAIERGYFRDEGLEVELAKVGGVEKATLAVLSGEAPFAITPPEGVIANQFHGGELCLIGANSSRLPMSLVARPEIKAVHDLRGRRIGTSSLTEGTALYTQRLLAASGLHYPADYGFVLAGIHTTRWEALQKGEIDAAPQPVPWNFLAAEQGYPLLGEISDVLPEVLFGALVGRRDWLRDHASLAITFLKALIRAHDYVNDPANTEICARIFQSITLKDNAALAHRGFIAMRELGMWPAGLALTDAALDSTLDLMIEAGLLQPQRKPEARAAYDPQYLKVAAR